MRVEKISGVSSANQASSGRSEHDKWASLENFRAADNKNNAQTELRNALGMTQEEYRKQADEARRLGFDEVLKRNLK
ncbi:MAG: hypothetical protein Q4B87_02815 [Candidatus Saccharibacteria bacterium]|nr:hypothetical protein [Candidatus Saccharibacteria bacterium]